MDHYGLIGKDLQALQRDREHERLSSLNYTTVKNARQLMATFNVDADTATTALALLFCDMEPEEIEATAQWVRSCLNEPGPIDQTLHAVNAVLGTHGVEGILGRDQRLIQYLNTGETYRSTLINDPNEDEWILCSWGQVVENEEAERERIERDEAEAADEPPYFPGMPPTV